ncbi:PH domain-containing protein [Candidatus Beckwithbacteria bacterium]|nr:PH domain-containing protein [Candidatus Beckwithbacteria bacterium]
MSVVYSSNQKNNQSTIAKPIAKSKKIILGIKEKFGTGRHYHPGGAFQTFPQKISFENQDQKEEIIIFLRRHIITNLGWILFSLLFCLAPVVFIYMPMIKMMPSNFQFIMFVLWYLFVLAFILENFLSWFFNVYIVTDERMIDVDFYSLIYKKVSDAKLDKIEDVTYVQGGLLQSFFNYGTVRIQTAGTKGEFEFEDVPKPGLIVKILNELLFHEEQEKIEGKIR